MRGTVGGTRYKALIFRTSQFELGNIDGKGRSSGALLGGSNPEGGGDITPPPSLDLANGTDVRVVLWGVEVVDGWIGDQDCD